MLQRPQQVREKGDREEPHQEGSDATQLHSHVLHPLSESTATVAADGITKRRRAPRTTAGLKFPSTRAAPPYDRTSTRAAPPYDRTRCQRQMTGRCPLAVDRDHLGVVVGPPVGDRLDIGQVLECHGEVHAPHLLASAGDPNLVAKRQGHASASFTLDRCDHVMPGHAAARLPLSRRSSTGEPGEHPSKVV